MIRKAKKIQLVKEGEKISMPLKDGSWTMMDAPEDGYVINIGKGVYSGVFVTRGELTELRYTLKVDKK